MDTLGTALQSAEAGARVSGIAVVRWVGPRKDVRTWTGAVVAKRECEVVDATLQPTTLAVWGYDKVVALSHFADNVVVVPLLTQILRMKMMIMLTAKNILVLFQQHILPISKG